MDKLNEMLESENIPREGQCMDHPGFFNGVLKENDNTIGFFTYRMEYGFPCVQHFIVDPEHRSNQNARKLIRLVVNHLLYQGHVCAIFQAPIDSYLNKFIQYYFKVKEPYGKTKDNNYYFCGLVKRGVS